MPCQLERWPPPSTLRLSHERVFEVRTMKRLILMRHAKSDWSSAGTSDHDRFLNDRGRQNAVSLGQWLAQRSLIPDAALCSTATRARQTLDLLDLPPYTSVTFHRNLYLASAETLLTALRAPC